MTAKSTPTAISERVARNVRTLRLMLGWSAQDLANRLDVAGCAISRSVIANRENRAASSRISVDELVALAAVFDLSVTDLLAESINCKQCDGRPPSGFTCNKCGASGVGEPQELSADA